MLSLQRLSTNPATLPVGLTVVVVLQFAILIRGNPAPPTTTVTDAGNGQPKSAATSVFNKEGDESIASLIAAAKTAFAADNADKAVALLSASLARDPAHPQALDLYRDRLHQQFDTALTERDWELAQVQMAAYDSAIRAGLVACLSSEQVDGLWRRQDELRSWTSTLDEKVLAECNDIEAKVDDSQPDVLPGLEARLRDLPTARITDDTLKRMVHLTERIATRQHGLNARRRRDRLAELRDRAQATDLDLNTLRELQTEVEVLHSEIVEGGVVGDTGRELLNSSRGLLGEVDRRVQVKSIHEMQTIADTDAAQSLEKAKKLVAVAHETTKQEKFQAAGEKLAEAELVLGTVDRLASITVQLQARKLTDEIRREALAVRSQQERRYNLWAICQLEQSIADYKKASSIWNDDEVAFKKILREKVGTIDPNHLHPATHALFTEMFQKLFGELSNEDRVEITRVIELAEKRRITDDSIAADCPQAAPAIKTK